MKRLIISLLALLALILPAAAQSSGGAWEIIPTYGTPTKAIDSPQTVWVLANGTLLGYDKETTEIAAFNRNNRLNGNKIAGIWYNPDKHYLFVVHNDMNIDMVYDDGRTVNVGDLMFSTTEVKSVNDVAFHGNNAYLATSAGLIILNAERGLILQTCFTSYPLQKIAVTDGWIFATKESGRILRAPRQGNHALNLFKETSTYTYKNGDIFPLDADKLLITDTNQDVAVVTCSDVGSLTATKIPNVRCVAGRMNPTKDGYTAQNVNYVSYIDHQGNLIVQTAHNIASLDSNKDFLTNWNPAKPAEIWRATAAGIGLWNATDKAYTTGPVKPVTTSGTNVGQFAPAPDGRIYLANIGIVGSTYQNKSNSGTAASIDIINKDGKIQPVNTGVTGMYSFAVNPKNSDEIVIGSYHGLYRYNVASKKLVVYREDNSSLKLNGRPANQYLVNGVCFDPEGNLWAIQNSPNPTSLQKSVHFVPANSWNNEAPKDSWTEKYIGFSDYMSSTRISFLPIGPGYLLIGGKGNLICIDLGNTYSDLSDDKVAMYGWTVDEDGLSIECNNIIYSVADQTNQVWIGTGAFLTLYKDISKIFTSSPAPSRPKVSRNDGTDLADHLCANMDTYWIAPDVNNHKWIATAGSGLYRVNEDGTQILNIYTTDNSDLPSNNIMAVYSDPNTNKVYVGTDIGLSILYTASSPAKTNYKEVYAYPNPVTPDYTGYITITGLMKDSQVKIADAAGRVFFEGTSDGGSLVWDGCDRAGNRVKSGVYFVFASQKNGSEATVTKIVVVN